MSGLLRVSKCRLTGKPLGGGQGIFSSGKSKEIAWLSFRMPLNAQESQGVLGFLHIPSWRKLERLFHFKVHFGTEWGIWALP